MALWTPPTNLPAHVLAPIQQVIDRIPPAHLLDPQPGKILHPDEAYNRLQDYAFSKGFCIVTASRNAANTYVRYKCIHHGKETRNWRKLEEHASKETNREKEFTNIHARGCPWQMYVSYKGVTKGK